MTRLTQQLRENLPGISQELLARQLRDALPGARQCGRCGFGPVLHERCSNLRTHHGDTRPGGGRISNACRQCGWFASNIAEWPRWDGEVKQDAAASNLVVPAMAGTT